MKRLKEAKRTLEALGMYREDEIHTFLDPDAVLVRPDGSPIRAKDLKPGDKVLVFVPPGEKGRHFGTAVEEFLIEI